MPYRRRRQSLGVLAIVGLLAACGRSSTPAPSGDADAPPGASAPGWHEAPGSDDRKCVDVDRLGGAEPGRRGDTGILNLRSGQIVAGNFASLAGSGTFGEADFVAKIYWLPLHNGAAKDQVLTVTITNLATGASRTQRFGGPGRWARSTDGYYFWATGIRMPGHARWRLKGEAAGHWGCFTLTT